MPVETPLDDVEWPSLSDSIGHGKKKLQNGSTQVKESIQSNGYKHPEDSDSGLDDIFICPLGLDDAEQENHSDNDGRPLQLPEDSISSPTISKPRVQRAFSQPIVNKWRRLVRRLMSLGDPWEAFDMTGYDEEVARRYRYSAVTQTWVTDMVVVKMQPESFARGAMRECFRMKKLNGTYTGQASYDWQLSQNYVSKRYMSPVDRDTYFEDVKLQMDAKLWGEEYNRHNPPKQVDIFQMSVLEFEDRDEKPLYHCEQYIEGNYIKYNSNSGFVSEVMRLTPQAFSHFTFERSGHQLIVVDIQGVGDLYTDPQIHTACGKGYGDGNLGTKGMALFFHSHVCNDICASMNLSAFDLSQTERAQLKKLQAADMRKMTRVCRDRIISCTSSKGSDAASVMEFIRHRSSLSTFSDNSNEDDEGFPVCSPTSDGAVFSQESQGQLPVDAFDDFYTDKPTVESKEDSDAHSITDSALPPSLANSVDDVGNRAITSRRRSGILLTPPSELSRSERKRSNLSFDNVPLPSLRPRFSLDASDGTCTRRERAKDVRFAVDERHERDDVASVEEEDKEAFWSEMRKRSRPSTVFCADDFKSIQESHAMDNIDNAVLGQIHLDVARYHELGRFLKTDEGSGSKAGRVSQYDATINDTSVTPADNYDRASAWFHLDVAVSCQLLEAIRTMADIYLGREHTLLADMSMEQEDDSVDRGVDLMEQAAELGDRAAMLSIAQAYDTGAGLGKEREQSWQTAVEWYQKAIDAMSESSEDDEEGNPVSQGYDASLDNPKYSLLARLAEMYSEGGHELLKNPSHAGDLYNEAAEAAMEAMKGKLANKYYMLAEEAYGEVEEDDE